MSKFAEKIYKKLLEVPPGMVTTYKELAGGVGVGAYRAVGQVLKNNPFAPEVPCHRVVKSDGSIGGFMGSIDEGSISKKVALLVAEGVTVQNGRVLEFEKVLYRFSE